MNEKIKEARKMLLKHIKKQGFNQQEIADKTGFTQGNVSRMLNSEYSPTLDNFISLCEATNCYVFIIDKDSDDDLCELMRNRWGKVSKN
jgi:transcriptional regulator with XRE-family HTH domain